MRDNVFTTQLFDIIIPQTEPDSNEDSYIILVMEYVQTDLKSVLKQYRNLDFSEDHVIIIMYNLLCAMNFIHTSNVLHRDIKPANILIDDDCRPKICDFGISRTRPENSIFEKMKMMPV